MLHASTGIAMSDEGLPCLFLVKVEQVLLTLPALLYMSGGMVLIHLTALTVASILQHEP